MRINFLKHGASILVLVLFGFLALGCGTAEKAVKDESPGAASQSEPQQKGEPQIEKFQRLLLADSEKIITGDDGKATIESIEAAFQPKVISSIGEITDTVLSEPGKPYYFKIRSIYKGHDKDAERVRLQDIGSESKNQGVLNSNNMNAIFGVDTNVYSAGRFNAVVSALPTEVNSIATFYLVAYRITDQGNETGFLVRFVRNIEKPLFDPSKFVVTSGMHYITLDDAHVPTQQDVMSAYFFGGAVNNASASVFDPVVYPLVDLFDARVAMDKKDLRNDYTFPTVKVKYVSEVVFKGQTNTTITVSTSDNALTERMNFSARTSTLKNGDRIRVYYTIAKDPLDEWKVRALEEWEVQAIERL